MQDTNKEAKRKLKSLPVIPEKLYFTIGEVSVLCDLKPHVLRYWEQEFKELSPTKRRGNRRYYQRKDVLLIRKIRTLLYGQGFTIEGARHQLSQKDAPSVAAAMAQPAVDMSATIADLQKVVDLLEN